MPKIKLYSTASSRFIPVKRAAEIVEPERDIPGTRAMPWNTPMVSAAGTVVSPAVLQPFPYFMLMNSSAEV